VQNAPSSVRIIICANEFAMTATNIRVWACNISVVSSKELTVIKGFKIIAY